MKKQNNPFKDLVLDQYEQDLEDELAKGDWKKSKSFAKRKKEVELIARKTLDLRKSKRITFRIIQGDLIRLKARAQEKSIPYQTLLTTLIRDFVEGKYSVKL